MRASIFATAGAMLLLWTLHASAIAPTPTNHGFVPVEAQKPANPKTSIPPDPIYVDVGGDTIGSAISIAALPYADGGSTCGFANDYIPNCASSYSGPDVVYEFTPSANIFIDIETCGSGYDTEIYVLQDAYPNFIACNDDACNLQSQLTHIALTPGHTYYIVIDGYYDGCGTYLVRVTENVCCLVACPPGSENEGEPMCHDDYYDTYNGGCERVPPTFTNLPCSNPDATTTICGSYGGFLYSGLSYRDSDWYQIILDRPATITWCVLGEYDTLCGVIDGNNGCPMNVFYDHDYNIGDAGTLVCVSDSLPAGTWWLWVGTLDVGPWTSPCGGDYVATLTGYDCGPTAVEPATWGMIKSPYR